MNTDDESTVRTVLEEVRALRAVLERLEALIRAGLQPAPAAAKDPAEQLVTLDQAAALVHRSKRTLERYRDQGMPEPRNQGRRGHPNLWAWADVRPWLERTFGFSLPEQFPASPV
jgi:hypothetical protein